MQAIKRGFGWVRGEAEGTIVAPGSIRPTNLFARTPQGGAQSVHGSQGTCVGRRLKRRKDGWRYHGDISDEEGSEIQKTVDCVARSECRKIDLKNVSRRYRMRLYAADMDYERLLLIRHASVRDPRTYPRIDATKASTIRVQKSTSRRMISEPKSATVWSLSLEIIPLRPLCARRCTTSG